MSEVNKVEFGVSNLTFFELTNAENLTYGTAIKVKGTNEITLSSKSDTTTLFADNGKYHVFATNSGYEGELSIYNFDDELKVKLFGFEKDKNGVLVEPSILSPKTYAMAFKVEGDVKARHSVLYACTFEKPDFSYKTTEDKVDVPLLKCKFKATPVYISTFEKDLVQASTIKSEQIAEWYTTPYKPVKVSEA